MGRFWLTALVIASVTFITASAVVEAQAPQRPPAPAPRVMPQSELTKPSDPGAFKKPRHDTPLRDGERAQGTRNFLAAWFSEPTNRYRHTPFGSELHPATLTVSTADRRVLRLTLPKGSVFEDRTPRIIDIDGDGTDEIVVIRSYERQGSALAIVAQRGSELEVIAETPPIGTPFRWLNPAGFADFDGDGKPDIALVATPHIHGELQFWTLRGGALEMIASTDDVSNHVYGSLQLKLSAVADFNGDGIADLAIPSQDRRKLRFFSLAGGKLDDLGEAELPAPAGEDFDVIKVAGMPAVRVGLVGGRHITIVPCRQIQGWEMASGTC